MLIPSKFNLGIISNRLTKELSSASNIKDKHVRKDVISALKSAQEIDELLKENMLNKLYISFDLIENNIDKINKTKCKLIPFTSKVLDKFGGIVGVRMMKDILIE